MAAYIDDAVTEIFTQVRTTLSSATVLFEAQEASVINWQDLIEDSALTPPYAIVRTMPLEPEDSFGMQNESYRLPVEIYYIISARASTDKQVAVEALIEDLRTAFRGTSYTNIQVIEDPLINCTVDNAANQYLLGANKPFYSGMMFARFLIGAPYA